jgi:hypothetical protein
MSIRERVRAASKERFVPCPHCRSKIPFDSDEIEGVFEYSSDETSWCSWVRGLKGKCPACKKEIQVLGTIDIDSGGSGGY